MTGEPWRVVSAAKSSSADVIKRPDRSCPRRCHSMNRRRSRTGRNPFRVVDLCRLSPRVASQARQPWALRRNPFGILFMRRSMVRMQVSRMLKPPMGAERGIDWIRVIARLANSKESFFLVSIGYQRLPTVTNGYHGLPMVTWHGGVSYREKALGPLPASPWSEPRSQGQVTRGRL